MLLRILIPLLSLLVSGCNVTLGELLSKQIDQSRYGWFSQDLRADSVYGLHTYVLIPVQNELSTPLLSEVFETTSLAGTDKVEPSRLNVFYIPVNDALNAEILQKEAEVRFAGDRKQFAASLASEVIEDLYDEGLARELLGNICTINQNHRPKFCNGAYASGGPYLVSLVCRRFVEDLLGRCNLTGPGEQSTLIGTNASSVRLYADLTGSHAEAANVWVSAYKNAVLDEGHPMEVTSIRAQIIAWIEKLADAAVPIAEARARIAKWGN